MRSSLAICSDSREDVVGFLDGEAESCDEAVTVVIVFAVFLFCKAILRRFARLAFCDNCLSEDVVVDAICWILISYGAIDILIIKFHLGLIFLSFPWIILIVHRHSLKARFKTMSSHYEIYGIIKRGGGISANCWRDSID